MLQADEPTEPPPSTADRVISTIEAIADAEAEKEMHDESIKQAEKDLNMLKKATKS